MVARGAMWNASIFCPKGKIPWEDVKREYVRKVCVVVVVEFLFHIWIMGKIIWAVMGFYQI
jgi:hypothetical protein